jgi:thioredoxin-like negative regulator of GroEL
MEPVVRGLEKQFGGRVEFRRLDIDASENQKFSKKYKVSGVPTYVFLDGNEELLFSRSGERSAEVMEKDLNRILQP